MISLEPLLGDLDPRECKLHCAVYDGETHPEDVLTQSWDEWLGWNSWRSTKDDFNRRLIFSMASSRTAPDLWLFGGVFEVLARDPTPHAHSYTIEHRPEYLGPYIKRLRVRYPRTGRTVRRLMEGALPNMSVAEILPAPYEGVPFPGLDGINHTLGELEVICRQQREDWRLPLAAMKGVYVIHDQQTGKAYVGAAYAGEGIWSRWTSYIDALGHAHNAGLRELVHDRGDRYARENLRFALLEYWSMRTDDHVVLEREAYWKQVLHSQVHGLNRN